MKFKKKCSLAIIGMMALSTVVMAQGGPDAWYPFKVCPVCGGQTEYGQITGDQFSFTCHNENKVYYGYLQKKEIQQESVAATLTVYVHEGSEDGPVIPNAGVEVIDLTSDLTKSPMDYHMTDANGRTTFTGATGNWAVTAEAGGYTDARVDTFVDTIPSVINIVLQKKGIQQESATTTPQGSENSIVGRWLIHRENGPDYPAAYCYVEFYSDGTLDRGEWYEGPSGALESLLQLSSGPRGSERDWMQYGDKINWQSRTSEQFLEGTIIGDTMSGSISYSGGRVPFSAERVSV